MPLPSLLVFALAYLAVLIVPGPGVTALVSRVLVRGPRGTPAFIGGFLTGALCWLTLAVTGLAALAAALGPVFTVVRWAGAAYLLWLAWKLWRAAPGLRSAAPAPAERGWRLFLTGLSINLGNPKAMVFFLALLPSVVDVEAITLAGYAELALTVALALTAVMGGYALLAARARRLFTTPRAARAVNRGSSVAMAGAAVALVTR
ncbi:LysE family translocator [Paroceanicella profunda]|uniref:LysE family translocator n=1 Tax=Paroceanicella profunda TaxID=2579971 RepID=A0A5B8FHQ5_9RHOB|nr:LysE family translocator [Paroceanicella profunda]QDL92467.1 LysE family translocator [Paroceanicella profunda]